MGIFKFNLQTVLEQRRSEEDAAQRELAKLLRENMVLETQLRGVQETVREDRSCMAGALAGAVDVARLRQHAAHASQVSARSHQFAVRMQGLRHQIDTARARLLAASKRRKAIERLHEKRYAAWHAQQQRRAVREADELGTQSHLRRLFQVETVSGGV